ncbi:MAG TPA: zinc-binding alcohol dehydrogenase family protein [Tepidisphaeraceae bacterium]|nr:zinc-binding alcohol dehydrogenase family protein [Tepidisphaeraceae bacterium]
MKAWLLDQPGRADRLRLADVADPVPAAGEVLLEVQFAAPNPADWYLAQGQYPAHPPLPHVLGRDGFGTVIAMGPGVTGVRIGESRLILRGEVGVSRWGTFAQKVTVPVESLVELPAGWTAQQAAGATLVYLTAYQALTQWGERPPSVVLISGASGGVGVAGIQLGAAMGHTVLALSRGVSKRQALLAIGAAAIFDPNEPAWQKQAREFLKGRRVDLAIDNIGGPLFPQMLETLGEWGKISVVGRLGGPVPEFNTAALLFRRLRVGGVAVGSYTNSQSRQAWQAILALLNSSGAKPIVDQVFPFDQLPAAFARLAQGPIGKVLIDMEEEFTAETQRRKESPHVGPF